MSEDEDRVERILGAAYRCFTRHGIRRSTMDDIAREAEMSRPTVYHYVRNKRDAYQRLAERMLGESLAASRAGAAGDGKLADRLTGALGAKLAMAQRLWADSPAHAAELLGADATLAAEMIAGYDAAMLALLTDTLRAALPKIDAEEHAVLLLAFTRGLEADLSDPEAPQRRLRQGVALFVAGLHYTQLEERS